MFVGFYEHCCIHFEAAYVYNAWIIILLCQFVCVFHVELNLSGCTTGTCWGCVGSVTPNHSKTWYGSYWFKCYKNVC